MSRNTSIINVIGGPGIGKSTICAIIFSQLKLKGFVVEYVQEYAKQLVWTHDFDTLNNQYYVTKTQSNLFKQMIGHVDFIVTDGSILHGLYYNRHNKDNTSNIEKTERLILDTYSKFNNINIVLERGPFLYEQHGRIETEKESKEIDIILRHMMSRNNINYESFISNCDQDNINKLIQYIESLIIKETK
jgi:uridine kinase